MFFIYSKYRIFIKYNLQKFSLSWSRLWSWSTKNFNFDGVQFIYFFFCSFVLLVSYLRNHCLIRGHKDFPRFLLRVLYSSSSYIQVFDPFWVNCLHMVWDKDPTSIICIQIQCILWPNLRSDFPLFLPYSIDHTGQSYVIWRDYTSPSSHEDQESLGINLAAGYHTTDFQYS